MLSKASMLQSKIPGLDDLLSDTLPLSSVALSPGPKVSIVSTLLALTEGEVLSDELGEVRKVDGKYIVELSQDAWFDSIFSLTQDADTTMSIIEHLEEELSDSSDYDKHQLLLCLRGDTTEEELSPDAKSALYSLKRWVSEEAA